MTREQYIKFEKQLAESGYRKYDGAVVNENYYFCKGFQYATDAYGDRTPAYQVVYSVWDYTTYAQVPDSHKFGVCARVILGTSSSRTDLELTADTFDIKDIETKAASFYEWVKANFKEYSYDNRTNEL